MDEDAILLERIDLEPVGSSVNNFFFTSSKPLFPLLDMVFSMIFDWGFYFKTVFENYYFLVEDGLKSFYWVFENETNFNVYKLSLFS